MMIGTSLWVRFSELVFPARTSYCWNSTPDHNYDSKFRTHIYIYIDTPYFVGTLDPQDIGKGRVSLSPAHLESYASSSGRNDSRRN